MPVVSLTSTPERSTQGDICAHCGAAGTVLSQAGERFCCQGCARVRTILKEQGLLEYYDFEGNDAQTLKDRVQADYSFCDSEWFKSKFVTPLSDGRYRITLKLPAIHCAACVWLLEKLPEILPGVLGARINYLAKEMRITAAATLPLSRVAQFVTDLGYAPDFAGSTRAGGQVDEQDRRLIRKLAVAAFGFGNAMLFSLPEYFSIHVEPGFARTFVALNAVIATAVLVFSAGGFFKSAWAALKQKRVVLDLPISIGITAMFARSAADIISGAGSGYADTFCGLIFFLLIGRYVQSRSYAWLNFERDNLLFLPLAVRVKKTGGEIILPVQDVKTGDRLRLLAGETLPMRSMVLSDLVEVDYAFITGESQPTVFRRGDIVDAGGKILGQSVELEVLQPVDQARLNRIWEGAAEKATDNSSPGFAEKLLPYFTGVVMAIAVAALLYWLPRDAARAWNAFSAVLIITCPCALAMAKPFSFFTVQSALARAGLYLKSASVVQKFWNLTFVVFDKTGTLTNPGKFDVAFMPAPLVNVTADKIAALTAIAGESTHPLSRAVNTYAEREGDFLVSNFREVAGKGLSAVCNGRGYFLGSAGWLGENGVAIPGGAEAVGEATVHAASDGVYLGYFSIRNTLRPGLKEAIAAIGARYRTALISGDVDGERARFAAIFGQNSNLFFSKKPRDKAEILTSLKSEGRTMMIGDGLNDAEALAAADLGVAITENHSNFSPASDAILSAASLTKLPALMALARQAKWTALAAYAISFAYNIFGVSIAVTGSLTPLFTAVLMPVSSVSVILLTFFAARLGARLRGVT